MPDARLLVALALAATAVTIAAALHAAGMRPAIFASGAAALAALGAALWAVGQHAASLAREREELRRVTAELDGASHRAEGMGEGLSQEVRSQVRAVDGFAQILENAHGTQLDREGLRTLSRLRVAAARAMRLISELSRFSDVGRQPLTLERVDMDALAREVVAALLPRHPKAKVRVAALPPSAGDPFLLRQLWSELLGNALKFSATMPQPEVEVDAVSLGDEVEYRVRDNGIGFEMAERHRLFAPFQRLHRPDENNGTGIGLAIARLVVARHAGRVRAEGRPGQGATFAFALPRRSRIDG